MKLFKFIKSEFVWHKIIWFYKKISFLSHLLKATLNLETAHVSMVPSQASKIGERISLERFALGEA